MWPTYLRGEGRTRGGRGRREGGEDKRGRGGAMTTLLSKVPTARARRRIRRTRLAHRVAPMLLFGRYEGCCGYGWTPVEPMVGPLFKHSSAHSPVQRPHLRPHCSIRVQISSLPPSSLPPPSLPLPFSPSGLPSSHDSQRLGGGCVGLHLLVPPPPLPLCLPSPPPNPATLSYSDLVVKA